jgi:hypothetical protein
MALEVACEDSGTCAGSNVKDVCVTAGRMLKAYVYGYNHYNNVSSGGSFSLNSLTLTLQYKENSNAFEEV